MDVSIFAAHVVGPVSFVFPSTPMLSCFSMLPRVGATEIKNVTAFGALLAGVVSFLSPCVLPLVPGYVSMLSGIGVEELKDGQAPFKELLKSSSAFVLGFSIVFMTFGATATAIGTFLLSNRSLVAPVAGALIVLFGLQLTGLLLKMPMKVGIAIGVLLIVGGGLSALFLGGESSRLKVAVRLCSLSRSFYFRPVASALDEPRFSFPQSGRQTRCRKRISDRICICIRVDSLHWPDFIRRAEVCGRPGHRWPGSVSCWPAIRRGWRFPLCCRHWRSACLFPLLRAISATSAHSGGRQRSAAARDWKFDIYGQTHVAFRQASVLK